jgi:DNA invertase Pin-like site-specific DNA recombinase
MNYMLIFHDSATNFLHLPTGIAKAKERGVYSGRAKKINDKKIVELKQKGYGATEIASEMGITRTSVYRALKAAS